MHNFVTRFIKSDRIVDLLVVTAIVIFALQVLSMLPSLIRIVPERPVAGILGAIVAIVSALVQPCMLLGLAKIISLIQSHKAPNA